MTILGSDTHLEFVQGGPFGRRELGRQGILGLIIFCVTTLSVCHDHGFSSDAQVSETSQLGLLEPLPVGYSHAL